MDFMINIIISIVIVLSYFFIYKRFDVKMPESQKVIKTILGICACLIPLVLFSFFDIPSLVFNTEFNYLSVFLLILFVFLASLSADREKAGEVQNHTLLLAKFVVILVYYPMFCIYLFRFYSPILIFGFTLLLTIWLLILRYIVKIILASRVREIVLFVFSFLPLVLLIIGYTIAIKFASYSLEFLSDQDRFIVMERFSDYTTENQLKIETDFAESKLVDFHVDEEYIYIVIRADSIFYINIYNASSEELIEQKEFLTSTEDTSFYISGDSLVYNNDTLLFIGVEGTYRIEGTTFIRINDLNLFNTYGFYLSDGSFAYYNITEEDFNIYKFDGNDMILIESLSKSTTGDLKIEVINGKLVFIDDDSRKYTVYDEFTITIPEEYDKPLLLVVFDDYVIFSTENRSFFTNNGYLKIDKHNQIEEKKGYEDIYKLYDAKKTQDEYYKAVTSSNDGKYIYLYDENLSRTKRIYLDIIDSSKHMLYQVYSLQSIGEDLYYSTTTSSFKGNLYIEINKLEKKSVTVDFSYFKNVTVGNVISLIFIMVIPYKSKQGENSFK